MPRDERPYHDKDYVVIRRRESQFYGRVGQVEVRPGHVTDFVWLGVSGVAEAPENLRRLTPEDKVVNP